MSGAPHMFRAVPRTGVIFVSAEADARGFKRAPERWANLGQGQPETGSLPEGPARVESVEVGVDDQEYAPVAGLWELREAVADLYNQRYRRGMGSRYSAENVAISGGGRMSLTRAVSALGRVNLGHFLPDYTAYEELLDIFRMFTPIPIMLEPERGYAFDADALHHEVTGRGLGAVLLSNPSNPMGRVIAGDELQAWVHTCRSLDCALLVDEFYAHYVWDSAPVSSAAFVEDVDVDPVVLFDGLTKNWRYPGWRVTWTVGPKSVIESVSSAGSFLDGGGARPLQRRAVELMTPQLADAEAAAIQARFAPKRALMVEGARRLGLRVDSEPAGTFYVWASTRELPEPLRDGMKLFHAALDEQVIVVPGEFFDVNPGKRRRGSRFSEYVRLSFGPEQDVLTKGLEGLQRAIDRF